MIEEWKHKVLSFFFRLGAYQDPTGTSKPFCESRWLQDACEAYWVANRYPVVHRICISSQSKMAESQLLVSTNTTTDLVVINTIREQGRGSGTYVSIDLLSKDITATATGVDIVAACFWIGHCVDRRLWVRLHIAAAERVVVGQGASHFLLRSSGHIQVRHGKFGLAWIESQEKSKRCVWLRCRGRKIATHALLHRWKLYSRSGVLGNSTTKPAM